MTVNVSSHLSPQGSRAMGQPPSTWELGLGGKAERQDGVGKGETASDTSRAQQIYVVPETPRLSHLVP